jgi:hypothetical protein
MGLSINPRLHDSNGPPSPLPSYAESEATKNHVDENDDDDDEEDVGGMFIKSPPPDDLHVEVLQDGLSSSLQGRSNLLGLGSGSDSEDGETNERFGRGMSKGLGMGRRYVGIQQGEVVEGDDEGAVRGGSELDLDLEVEDITAQYQGVKRRGIDGISGPGRKRRRNRTDGGMGMDVDMQGDEVEEGNGRRRTQWHEPEKDRKLSSLSEYTQANMVPGIIITSIGSPDSSASERSLSPEVEDKRLAQPGANGFTLNPSLLTHLLSRHDDLALPFQPKERGLVLYKPLGIQPGSSDYVVQTWQGYPGLAQDDAGRFEEIDDEEDRSNVEFEQHGMMDMEGSGDSISLQDADGDVSMDLD